MYAVRLAASFFAAGVFIKSSK
ncbi:hypothetical protein EFR64_09365 [Lactobacillus crispatus]|nr:hypothetical protein [Lactobacillus crispatus]